MEAATRVPLFMTLQEFLGWDAPWGPPWQLVDGVPQAMALGSRTHNSLMVELSALLRNHFVGRALPCSVLASPGVVPRVRANINYRIPDLAVTCSSCREEECYLDDPVLLVEILSPSNAPETWTNIWAYTSIPSLQEILILRSTQVGAELLRRDAAGNWPAEAMTIEAGMLELTSIDFQVELAAIYRDTRFAAG